MGTDLFRWLQNLGRACRDDIPEVALGAWVLVMETWGPLSDEQWASVARQVMLEHRAGPLKLPEILDAVRDALCEAERRENMRRLSEMKRDPEGGPEPAA